ncbi:MAG: hypothetical protein Q8K92_09025 [Leadbetterella sp.]|nr:hypothetical protein [Leadbetterella sp.]
MEQSTLKTLRILIPGLITIIIFLIFYSVIRNKDIFELKLIDYSYITIIALAVGTLYYLLEPRHLVTNLSHKKIDLNIKNHIINLYTSALTKEQRQFLFQKNILKNIFYRIVDNDESLKKKSSLVYFNGLIWTSTADLFLLSGLSSIFFLFSIVIYKEHTSELLLWAIILICFCLISLFLHALSYLRHIKISNDQIEYIETHHINQVNDHTNNVLQQMSNPSN